MGISTKPGHSLILRGVSNLYFNLNPQQHLVKLEEKSSSVPWTRSANDGICWRQDSSIFIDRSTVLFCFAWRRGVGRFCLETQRLWDWCLQMIRDWLACSIYWLRPTFYRSFTHHARNRAQQCRCRCHTREPATPNHANSKYNHLSN